MDRRGPRSARPLRGRARAGLPARQSVEAAMDFDHTFTDKKGRQIGLSVTPSSVTAFDGNRRIGGFTMNPIELPDGEEVHADVIGVDDSYRNAGIGKEMV